MAMTTDWARRDAAHHLHPFTTHAALAASGSRFITEAEGVWVRDSDGNRFLDAMAGLWCVNIGYGRRELAETAYRVMLDIGYANSFFQSTNPWATDLATRLAGLPPAGLDRVMFANSGSEANDTIVKIVRYYWNLCGQPNKKMILSRHRAYHGVTVASASLSGLPAMHRHFDLPLSGSVDYASAPCWYDYGGDDDPDIFGLKAARSVEDLIMHHGADRVGAFIGEPIMGAGGVIIPPASYWPELEAICRRHDVLLIADEVICGFGRTGRWFGCDYFGFEPDLMSMAKGLSSGYMPISAVRLGRNVGDVIFAAEEEWAHGFTYSGHPVACAVALENLRILDEEKLIEGVATIIGPYFKAALAGLADHAIVGEVRCCGLLAAIELASFSGSRTRFPTLAAAGQRCRDHALAAGLIMRACGDTMVLAPPLCITPAEVDDLVERARKALDATERDLR